MDHKNISIEISKHLDDLAKADHHSAIEAAEKAVFAVEDFIARLVTIGEDVEDLINLTLDNLGDIVGRALRQEEEDRVNRSFRREVDAANERRNLV